MKKVSKAEKKFSLTASPKKHMESLKLVLFGTSNVGKSALLVRLVTGRFITEYASEEEITKTYVLPRIDNQENVKLDVTDPTNCVSYRCNILHSFYLTVLCCRLMLSLHAIACHCMLSEHFFTFLIAECSRKIKYIMDWVEVKIKA